MDTYQSRYSDLIREPWNFDPDLDPEKAAAKDGDEMVAVEDAAKKRERETVLEAEEPESEGEPAKLKRRKTEEPESEEEQLRKLEEIGDNPEQEAKEIMAIHEQLCLDRGIFYQVEVGDKYNLKELLSFALSDPTKLITCRDDFFTLSSNSESRKILIRYKDDQPYEQVNFSEIFEDKYILLLFIEIDKKHNDECTSLLLDDLREMYDSRRDLKDFEVVFIALGENEEVFRQLFSQMPWLAIPHEESLPRAEFIYKLGIPWDYSYGLTLLFQPDGTLLRKDDTECYIRKYGPKGFPFDEEKLYSIGLKDADFRKNLYEAEDILGFLLGDHVFSAKDGEVNTSELKNKKVVGLYFLEDSYKSPERTEKLIKIWNLLNNIPDKDFEIILVNGVETGLSYVKEYLKKELQGIPWYSLNTDGRKLCRIFRHWWNYLHYFDVSEEAGRLIIIEPNKPNHLDYFAYDILSHYGVEAYPFTVDSVVELEMRKAKDLVLDKLLCRSAILYRSYKSAGDEVNTTVKELSDNGLPVLLYLADCSCYRSESFLHLRKLYMENKGTFEVVYIPLPNTVTQGTFCNSFCNCIKQMPWLIHACEPMFGDLLLTKLFEFEEFTFPLPPVIAAFGPNGNLVARSIVASGDWSPQFPFISDVDEDKQRCLIRSKLIRRHGWNPHGFVQALFSYDIPSEDLLRTLHVYNDHHSIRSSFEDVEDYDDEHPIRSSFEDVEDYDEEHPIRSSFEDVEDYDDDHHIRSSFEDV